jgi:choline dehydrogenase
LDAAFAKLPDVSSSAALTNPFSRGNVIIISNDTSVRPIVDPNWMLDPRDQEVAVAAFRQARAVFTNNTGTEEIVLGSEAFPGTNVTSDAQIPKLIRQSAAASYHASCTCAMGRKDDPMAGWDSEARVYGVQGLRVVDALAFPVLPPGHPSATICKFSRL